MIECPTCKLKEYIYNKGCVNSTCPEYIEDNIKFLDALLLSDTNSIIIKEKE